MFSKQKADNDGFIVVTRKKGKAVPLHRALEAAQTLRADQGDRKRRKQTAQSLETVEKAISSALQQLKKSPTWESLRSGIEAKSAMVAGKTAPWSILALGIGNFGDAAAAALQLAVLIQVVDMLACKRVEVYDPIFTEAEKAFLKAKQFNVLEANTLGKENLEPGFRHFVYFPHCPALLTSNFLWYNWGPILNRTLLLSNSITKQANSFHLNPSVRPPLRVLAGMPPERERRPSFTSTKGGFTYSEGVIVTKAQQPRDRSSSADLDGLDAEEDIGQPLSREDLAKALAVQKELQGKQEAGGEPAGNKEPVESKVDCPKPDAGSEDGPLLQEEAVYIAEDQGPLFQALNDTYLHIFPGSYGSWNAPREPQGGGAGSLEVV